jgi:phage-related protein
MSSRIAEAYVQIVPRIDGVARKLNTQLSGELAKSGALGGNALAKGVGNGFGSKIKTALKIGFAGATIALGAFAKSAVGAASDFEESIAAVGEVFGSAAGGIEEFAKSGASALGQSQTQILSAARQFGIYGQAAGLAGEANVQFAKDLVSLATDVASFNNVSVDEAILAIGSGLRGEAEPLRRFGVLLDDATLRAKALELGIVNTTKQALTPQNKILAANALIFEQTATQQGDFARTSDGLANSQRILAAQFENLKITAGAALAPAFGTLVKALVPVIEALGPVMTQVLAALAPALTSLAGILPPLITALLPLAPIFADLIAFIGELAAEVLPVFVALIEQLMPVAEELFPIFMELVSALLPLIPIVMELVEAFLPIIVAILPPLISLIKALLPVVSLLIKIFVAVAIPVIQFLATVIGAVVGAIAGLIDWFVKAGVAVAKGIGEIGKNIFKFFADLPKNIMSFLSGAGTWLFNLGKDIIQGLIDGISNAAKNIGQFFSDIGKTAINAFKNIFGIASPSKVMKGFGKDIMKGLEKGLLAGESSIRSTMKKVGDWVSKSFKDGLISKDAAKTARELIKSYRKQLLSLQKDLDSVNEKLGDAQDELADRIEERLSYINNLTQQFGAELKIDEQTTATSAIQYLRDRIAKTEELAKLSKELIALGLNDDLYRQIIEAGAVDFAASIIEGGQTAVDELNVLSAQANKAALELATEVGDVLFNEGIVFAQSVVDGLLAQKTTIEEMMKSIATAFATELNSLIATATGAIKALGDASAKASQSAAVATANAAKINDKLPKQTTKTPTIADAQIATKKALNQIGNAVAKAVPGALSWKPMAKGGFVNEPTRALIGEAGPEVVVPLKKFEQYMGLDDRKGNTIVYNAAPNNSINSEQALFQAIKRARVLTAW